MSLAQPAMMLYLMATAEPSSDTTAVAILVALFALQFAVMLILRRLFRPDDARGDDPGSGGDGPGWRRRGPHKPPPDEPVCWPEFERQFAEHVASLRARERTSSQTNEDRADVQ